MIGHAEEMAARLEGLSLLHTLTPLTRAWWEGRKLRMEGDLFGKLERPFRGDEVCRWSTRHGWQFTFRDADGREHLHAVTIFQTYRQAEDYMKSFIDRNQGDHEGGEAKQQSDDAASEGTDAPDGSSD